MSRWDGTMHFDSRLPSSNASAAEADADESKSGYALLMMAAGQFNWKWLAVRKAEDGTFYREGLSLWPYSKYPWLENFKIVDKVPPEQLLRTICLG